ncbi:MAG: FAD-dependent oxidoreductase [Deltaproteobacteria bacterium]|nr:FAD-dependent oxidoreductase [Deltaproteobacteria bacterium]
MSRKIVIIGAVALGPKVACRAYRADPTVQVTLIDQNRDISYGGCGIPFFVSGDISDIKALMSTSFHLVRDESFFKEAKGVLVHSQTRATAINRRDRKVRLQDLLTGREEDCPYDTLVLATGAVPVKPNIPGIALEGVTTLSNPAEAQLIKNALSQGQVTHCVIIGAGPIGLEMAQAVSELWGVETTLLEIQDQILPGILDPDLARMLSTELKRHEVNLLLEERAVRILGDDQGKVIKVITDQREIPADLVILAAGVRPNTSLAEEAGLTIGSTGAISVNEFLQTSDPDIYAGGDCIELPHLITRQPVWYPSGSLANRQGRVIGTNAAGGRETFPGVTGSFAVKLFDLSAGRSGLTQAAALQAGFDAQEALVIQADRAHFYPGQELIALKLVADRKTRRVLGLSGVAKNGDALLARLNAIAGALPYQPTIEDVANLEIPYSPPFSGAMDILNAVANTLKNTLEGKNRPLAVDQFRELFEGRKENEILFVDVRGPRNALPYVQRFSPDWINIPGETLTQGLGDLPKNKRLVLVCNSGVRSYEAQIVLDQEGITNTLNLAGGIAAVKWAGLNPLEEED